MGKDYLPFPVVKNSAHCREITGIQDTIPNDTSEVLRQPLQNRHSSDTGTKQMQVSATVSSDTVKKSLVKTPGKLLVQTQPSGDTIVQQTGVQDTESTTEIFSTGTLADWFAPGENQPSASLHNAWQTHTDKPVHFQEAVPRNNPIPDIFFLSLLIVVGSITLAKAFFSRYFPRIIQSFFNENQALNLYRSRNLFTTRVYLLLLLNSFITIPLWFYLIIYPEKTSIFADNTFPEIFLAGFLLVSFLLIFRWFVNRITGYLFDSQVVFSEYGFFIRNFYAAVGITLIPLLFLAAYFRSVPSTPFMVLAAAGILLLYFIRLYRGFRIAIRYHVPKLYLFLYFCALEILPVLLGYKFIRILSGI